MTDYEMTDYELAKAAQNGSKSAELELWNRYRGVSIGLLSKTAHLEKEELEGEAYIIFHHKLYDLLDLNKIGCKPESWTFSFMITGGMKNLRSKLINESKRYDSFVKLSYRESDEEEEISQDQINVKLYGEHTFNVYNPEAILMKEEEPVTDRVRKFYSKLSAFDKAVLEKRRQGVLLKDIAIEFGCSLSKVKAHLKYAKEMASEAFGLIYA